MSFPVTSLVAAALALLIVALAGVTVAKRVQSGHPWGDGGDAGLVRAIRAHGNLIEYAPIFLLLLALLEARGANADGLVVTGGVFLVSRAVYVAYAFGRQALALRIVGFWTSALPIAGAAGWLIAGAIGRGS